MTPDLEAISINIEAVICGRLDHHLPTRDDANKKSNSLMESMDLYLAVWPRNYLAYHNLGLQQAAEGRIVKYSHTPLTLTPPDASMYFTWSAACVMWLHNLVARVVKLDTLGNC